jgi:hypothetical protein
MATTKVDFSDSTVLEAVSTAVQTKVVAAAAADATIVVDTTAFASVLETAVTAVGNVNAAIEAITDTDLNSTASKGTFATLTDVANEIKAAAEAEVAAPGSGAALVTLTDASAVTAAVAEAVTEVEATEAAEAGDTAPVVVEPDAGSGGGAAAAAPVVVVVDTSTSFVVTSGTGATWTSGANVSQSLDATFSAGVLDVTQDVEATATEFKAAFGNTTALTNDVDANTALGLGTLSIPNVRNPAYGSKDNAEVTIVIDDTSNSGKITVGFTLDWTVSGTDVTVSSDDSTLDITYVERDNSSTTLSFTNDMFHTDILTITNDGTYAGNSTINVNALALISDLNASPFYDFDSLETRFAVAGTELDVSVDISNLGVYYGSQVLNTITSTIDIV